MQGLEFVEIYWSQEAGYWDQLKKRQASIEAALLTHSKTVQLSKGK